MSRRSTLQRSLGRVLLACALMGGGVQAPAAPPNYFIRTWQVESGLPQNKVTAVVQAVDAVAIYRTCNRALTQQNLKHANQDVPTIRIAQSHRLRGCAGGDF